MDRDLGKIFLAGKEGGEDKGMSVHAVYMYRNITLNPINMYN